MTMSDQDRERLREIEASQRSVDLLRLKYERADLERKSAKEQWATAQDRHFELCRAYDESEEVAERPLIRKAEEAAEANGLPALDEDDQFVQDTQAALVSVGHQPGQALVLMARALQVSGPFDSVADWVESIYADLTDNEPEPPALPPGHLDEQGRGEADYLTAKEWSEEPTADHEEDEPDYHGESVAELEALADEGLIERLHPLNGWDTDTAQPVAELEALADEGLIERKTRARRSNRKGKA